MSNAAKGEDAFSPSAGSTARWNARHTVALVAAVPFALMGVLAIVTRHWVGVLLVLCGALIVVASVVGPRWYWSSRGRRPRGARWVGISSLRLRDLRAIDLARGISVKNERRLRFWSQGTEALGCRMEIRSDGLCWTLGHVARWLLGAHGSVYIPWSEIAGIEVGPVPGTIRAAGFGMSIQMIRGRRLDAEVSGSIDAVRSALGASPIANDA